METTLAVAGIIFFGVLSRTLLALDYTGDQHGVVHYMIRLKKRRWIGYDFEDSVQDGAYPYPHLVYYLTSLFPQKYWRVVSMLFGLMADVIVGVWLYFLLEEFLPLWFPNLGATKSQELAQAGTWVFLTLPLLFPVTSRLRASNARAFGIVLVIPAMWFAYDFSLNFSLSSFFLSSLFIYLCFLGSLFAMQTVIFFGLLMSLLSLNLALLAPLAFIFTLGQLLVFLKIKEVFMFKVAHFIWYYKYLRAGGVGDVKERNLFYEFVLLPYLLLKDRKRFLRAFTKTSILSIVIYSFIPGILWTVIWVNSSLNPSDYQHPVLNFSFLLSMAAVLMVLLSSVGKGKIFGQAERYLEYCSPFSVLLFVHAYIWVGHKNTAPLYSLVVIQLAIIVLIHILSEPTRVDNLLRFEHIGQEEKAVVDFLAQRQQQTKALVIPVRSSQIFSTLSINQHSHKIKYYYRLLMKKQGMGPFDLDTYLSETGQQMQFARPLSYFQKTYGINTLIIKNQAFEKEGTAFLKEAKEKSHIVFRNESYTILSV